MKFMLTVIVSLILLACSNDAAQTATAPERPDLPTQPSGSLTWVWGMAVDESGGCVIGATATVVRGQGLGQSIGQTTPCGAWDSDGGFIFKNMAPGMEMTVRVSALGYAVREKTIVPSAGPQSATLFVLTRIP